jgi:ABC-type antimicrobial peptide transport system permease subunit
MDMGVVVEAEPTTRPTGITVDTVLEYLAWAPQTYLGLLPRTMHRCLGWLLGKSMDEARGGAVLGLSVAGAALGFLGFIFLFVAALILLAIWAHIFPGLVQALAAHGIIAEDSGWLNLEPASAMVQAGYAFVLAYLSGLLVKAPYDGFGKPFRALRGILWLRAVIARIGGLLCLMGLGLLPLASLLMFLPLVMPQEAVLTDTLKPARSRLARGVRRAAAIVTGMAVLLALMTFGIQVATWFGLRSPVYSNLARQLLPDIVMSRLPVALVEGWPFVLLVMYATDFVLLFLIGKVPLQYNLRNLRVRWITTLMTGVAFTVVVFLLVLMMSFVDSVNRLTASTGIPGNVFVLSEGSTDELFSNLAYGDVNKLELEKAVTDPQGRPLAVPIAVKTLPGKAGQPPTRLVSKETYFVINQEIAKPSGGGPSRRFVQLRGVEDAEVAGKVHDISLLKGEWFGREGAVEMTRGHSSVPCVLGEGASAAFGADYGKDRLDVGDTFKLGNLDMVVVGVMKSAGKTFDSETWAIRQRVGQEFGKQAFTTVVIRVSDDNPETVNQSAETFAYHLSKNFANPRVRAVPEPRYYEDLAKSNSQLMFMVVVVAIIMAMGGVIGVMLVMFAAIAQRVKDVGVMRVVGYKRWQILVSFMLESLAIALIGGLVGVLLIMLVDGVASAAWGGLTVTSNVSSGQGGKTVVTKLAFKTDVVASGILFTIIMGRLGGLLPSVGAMRLGILESLR